MAKGKKGKGSAKRERKERRFLAESAGNPLLVKILGAAGAAALGAGTWAEFGRAAMNVDLPPYPFAPYVLGGGALVFGAAVWLGTTNEDAVRVGAAGIAIEKSEIVRLPWHGIERIVWDPHRAELSIRGKDESGKNEDLVLTAKTHSLAAAWVAREARERIPDLTDVPDEVDGLPPTRANDGEILALEPLQVVGRHCAESGRIIAYEPDGRVCPRCERVYHKQSVPEDCECGASLTSLRQDAPGTATAPAAPAEEAPAVPADESASPKDAT